MKRVLVTGGTGFVGRQALPILCKAGYEVHATWLHRAPPKIEGVRWHSADLLKPGDTYSLFERLSPTHLLHFAWYAVPGRFWTAPENLSWITSSLTLMQAFQQYGGRRVVMAGSCAEYDWSHDVCNEWSTPCNPATLYGASKNATRVVLDAWSKQMGLSAAWGRIFFLYGPGEDPVRLVPSVINALLRDQPARCTHGNQVRDFMHVADVAAAFVALLDSDVTGAVNIASGNAVPLRDIIFEIADSMGKRQFVQLGALAAPPGEPDALIADISRLRSEVGFRPSFELQEGIADTIANA